MKSLAKNASTVAIAVTERWCNKGSDAVIIITPKYQSKAWDIPWYNPRYKFFYTFTTQEISVHFLEKRKNATNAIRCDATSFLPYVSKNQVASWKTTYTLSFSKNQIPYQTSNPINNYKNQPTNQVWHILKKQNKQVAYSVN